MVRNKPLRRNPVTTQNWINRSRKALPRTGKKTKQWNNERASLKRAFSRSGITTCELHFTGCWRDNGLGFAHSLKRRNIQGDQIREVVLACANCHPIIEVLPEKRMTEYVRTVISERRIQPA